MTRYLDDKKEIRERKIRLFKVLMATRGAALSPAHVEALNMIDLEFNSRSKKEREVIESWKIYLDHLSTRSTSFEQWGTRRHELLVELLHKMAIVLNYEFDKVHIKNAAYIPRGHGEIEDDQTAIRRGFRELLEKRRDIPVHITNLPAQNPPQQIRNIGASGGGGGAG